MLFAASDTPSRAAPMDLGGSAMFPFWEHAKAWHLRVFDRSTVAAVAGEHADARQALFALLAEVGRADWSGPDDIKTLYPCCGVGHSGVSRSHSRHR